MSVLVRHPVDNPSISEGFGDVGWRIHHGIDYRPDFPGQVGKIIYAPCDMEIAWARKERFAPGNPWEQLPNSGDSGNAIIAKLRSPNWAVHLLFAHMDKFFVQEGQFVTTNTPIGTMGWSGNILPKDPTGTHLHFELFIDYAEGVYPDGTFYGRVNPLDYFQTVTTVPIAPGASGGSAVGTAPAPKLLIPGINDLYI